MNGACVKPLLDEHFVIVVLQLELQLISFLFFLSSNNNVVVTQLFKIVSTIYDVVPDVLRKQGKVRERL